MAKEWNLVGRSNIGIVDTSCVAVWQSVWVESKQVCRDISISLQIKENITDNMKHREMLHK
jgi:hypothetical protein